MKKIFLVLFLILSGFPVFAASGLAGDGFTMMMFLAGAFLLIAAILKGYDLLRKNRHRIYTGVILAWRWIVWLFSRHGRKHEFSHDGIW
ncbi:MAG: hypothetical protein ACM3N9_05015 [Syntrophothermus sp.]